MKINRWVKTLIACAAIVGILAAYKMLQIRSAIAFAESFPEHSESVESTFSQLIPYTKHLIVIGEVAAPQWCPARKTGIRASRF